MFEILNAALHAFLSEKTDVSTLSVATAVVFSQGQSRTVKLGRATLFKACYPSEKVGDQDIGTSNKFKCPFLFA